MSKEPLKSFINKMGTFRGKKASNRPSASDLKYGESHDESGMFKVPLGVDENAAPFSSTFSQHESCSDLDTTAKSMSGTGTLSR